DDLASYHTLLAAFTAATTSAKTSFFQSKIDACVSNPRKLFSTFSSLLIPPPPPSPSSLSADDFLTHFEGKVAAIRNSFTHPVTPHIPHTEPIATLSSFKILEDSDVLQLVTRHRATTCPLDPIPSEVLQSISAELLPYLSSIINTSLICGHVPAAFKTARVTPLKNLAWIPLMSGTTVLYLSCPSCPKQLNVLSLTNCLFFSTRTTCLTRISPASEPAIPLKPLSWL
ncbi:hypothetical protein SKAU_G00136100, partial [Synaphobranchus kaupii]